MTLPHALVLGGTGMLRGVSLELAARGFHVTVVARRPGRLADLVAEARQRATPGVIHPAPVDWHDARALQRALTDAAWRFGAPSLAVVWVHSTAPDAPLTVAQHLTADALYLHVLGSASSRPGEPGASRRAAFQRHAPTLRYREVVLGFMLEGEGSRWLSDDEIAGGVLSALDQDAPRTLVGVVEPWERRPGGGAP